MAEEFVKMGYHIVSGGTDNHSMLIDLRSKGISGKDAEDNNVKKEMVIQKDGKECVFELLKGIYTYEIVLSNKEVYKKGEYKFNEEITITVKPD
jgi:hypothetical protein